MIYLFSQTLFWLLLAFLLGLALGWMLNNILCGGSAEEAEADNKIDAETAVATAPVAVEEVAVTEDMRPAVLEKPDGEPDDLTQISGIGPVIAKALNEQGIYHFRQIAEFTEDNVAWVNQHMAFPGRIEREQWIQQAKALVS